MQKAKAAAASFLSRDGKHKTTVDQDVNAAVTQEEVKPHVHENVTTAVDREVHQDHHQTRIQPVKAQETLAETSEHVMEPTVHKTFDHTNDKQTRDKLEQERAGFVSTSTTHDTTHSTSVAPAVTGERVHHHVHEHIQPVIQKETHAPHVVHKTVPVHETHHAAPVHHEVTTLPVKSIDEFRSAGHSLGGENTTVHKEYDGCPGAYNKGTELPKTALGSGHSEAIRGATDSSEYNTRSGGLSGTADNTPRQVDPHHKPSLKEKLDPRIDANGDGKAGILS